MALTKVATKTVYGTELTFPNSYIKIGSYTGDKINLSVYVDTYTEKGGELLSGSQHTISIDLSGKNFISQGYDYLKTLPEFADAVDC